MSAAVEERLSQLWETPHTLWGELTTVDHKKLGKRYLATAFVFLLIGGLEALLMRLQLAGPNQGILGPEAYYQVFTMHGITMIFWYAQPILSGFAIYLIPLMIGSRDLAFPRLNAFTYWAFLFSGLMVYGSAVIYQAPRAGWFAYIPLTSKTYSPGLGMDFYVYSLILLTISTTGGAINFVVTIFRQRAPGMTISRMPLFLYSTLTVSVAAILSMPSLTAALMMLELDRKWGFHFFDPSHGGLVLMWQQLFWFFGHPWVYVIFLPATGMISMIFPVFSRRPIVGYPYVAVATVMTGLVGFGVWVHHMFAVGMSMMSMSFFSAASMTISVFSAVQVLAWIATVWLGRPVMTAAFHFALGFLAVFIIGGLNGIITAVIPFDWQLTDTYFVVAHIHYVLVGANMLPVFAGFYYWYPKMTGRMLSERLGKISFWWILIGLNVAFFPMHILALLGMPRRQYTYASGLGWGRLNMVETVGAFVLAFGILLTIINFIKSARSGAPAGRNPWHADTLEWSTDSPPPPYGVVHIPTVRSRNPLWDEHEEETDPTGERILDQGRLTLSSSSLDASPSSIARMPEDSILPLLLALAISGTLLALLFMHLWLGAAFALVSVALAGTWLWPKHRDSGSRTIDLRVPEDMGPQSPITTAVVPEVDDHRGTYGTLLFILTEGFLFLMLFTAYFYLARGGWRWLAEKPPALHYVLPMLAILLGSSGVVYWGEQRAKRGDYRNARLLLLVSILMGIGFLALSAFDYKEHLRDITPRTDAYGSIFYTITTLHVAHVCLGLLLLAFALIIPRLEPRQWPPYRPYHNASLYWHFVDFVWVFIVLLLYVAPNIR